MAAKKDQRVLLTLPEAAEACSVSLRFFRDQILPELKVVRVGRRVLIAVSELQKWAEASGTLV